MRTTKPLFIPLNKNFFLDFVDGWKTEEFRLYGHRWNEKTCFVGREVVLSKGYGKSHRLRGCVQGFKKVRADELWSGDQVDFLACYGRLDVDVACILIKLSPEQHKKANK